MIPDQSGRPRWKPSHPRALSRLSHALLLACPNRAVILVAQKQRIRILAEIKNLNLRTITTQNGEVVPRRAHIGGSWALYHSTLCSRVIKKKGRTLDAPRARRPNREAPRRPPRAPPFFINGRSPQHVSETLS